MNPRQKSDHFRKQIRREQITSLFKQKRRELQNYQCSLMSLQENLCTISNSDSLTVDQLKKLTKLSQTKYGSSVIVQANLFDKICCFLSFPLTSDELFYATTLLSNYLNSPLQWSPPSQFLLKVVDIVSQGQARVKDPCLNILRNVLDNYPKEKDLIVARCNLLDVLQREFESSPQNSTLIELVELLYYVLKEAPKLDALRQFNKYLYRIILGTNDYMSIVMSLECVRLNLNMFQSMGREMKVGGIFTKLFGYAGLVKEGRFIIKVIQCAQISIQQLNLDDFISVLGLFRLCTTLHPKLLGNSNHLKQVIYRIIFDFIYYKSYCLEELCSEKNKIILQLLFKDLEQQESNNIVLQLGYIFVLIYFQEKNDNQKIKISNGIKRAQSMHSQNVQFKNFLQTIFYK